MNEAQMDEIRGTAMPTSFQWLAIWTCMLAAGFSYVAVLTGGDAFRVGVLGSWVGLITGAPGYLAYRRTR